MRPTSGPGKEEYLNAPAPATDDATVPALLTLEAMQAATPHQHLEGCALVLRSDAATDRTGHTYLSLTLRGADGGNIEARWWRYPYPLEQRPAAGQICWFTGDLDAYHGEPQLHVDQARPAPSVEPDLFVRTTRRHVEDLRSELAAVIDALEPDLAALVRAVLSGEVYERFCIWPASQQRHGAVRHGLLAHTLCVAALARNIAAAYGPQGLSYDCDLVTAACLLHDVGKVFTLPAVAGAPMSDAALLYGHVVRGMLMVWTAAAALSPGLAPARLDALMHALLAHHGRKEWGSPIEPHSVEAWLVHAADLVESQLWAWSNEEQP